MAKGKIINSWEHNGWGDTISFFDWKKRKISGHMTPLPKVGDELRFKMESGKIGRFVITKIDPCNDPPDQFFGVVKDLKYLD